MENPREKIKSIKNPIKLLLFSIKSETSDSFVNHFDGHFAYLKTLDFYFKHWHYTVWHFKHWYYYVWHVKHWYYNVWHVMHQLLQHLACYASGITTFGMLCIRYYNIWRVMRHVLQHLACYASGLTTFGMLRGCIPVCHSCFVQQYGRVNVSPIPCLLYTSPSPRD